MWLLNLKTEHQESSSSNDHQVNLPFYQHFQQFCALVNDGIAVNL